MATVLDGVDDRTFPSQQKVLLNSSVNLPTQRSMSVGGKLWALRRKTSGKRWKQAVASFTLCSSRGKIFLKGNSSGEDLRCPVLTHSIRRLSPECSQLFIHTSPFSTLSGTQDAHRSARKWLLSTWLHALLEGRYGKSARLETFVAMCDFWVSSQENSYHSWFVICNSTKRRQKETLGWNMLF